MSPWGWRPERTEGIWRYGPPALKPFVVAAPWITVVLLLLMFRLIDGTLAAEKGALFDLPDTAPLDAEATGLVALVMPMAKDTLVFFDDSRYVLDDPASVTLFAEQFAARVATSDNRTLLILADRRVRGGELMRLAALARKGGAKKILFAEKEAKVSE